MATSTVDKTRIPGLKYKDTDEKAWEQESAEFKSAVIMHYVPGNPVTPFGMNRAKPFTTHLLLKLTIDELINDQFKGKRTIPRSRNTFAEMFKTILQLAALYNKQNNQYDVFKYSSHDKRVIVNEWFQLMMIVKYCTPNDYLEIEKSGKIPKCQPEHTEASIHNISFNQVCDYRLRWSIYGHLFLAKWELTPDVYLIGTYL